MKFDQFIKYKIFFFFFKTHAQNQADFFLFFKKAIGKKNWSAAWFYYILKALKSAYNKSKMYKTLDYSFKYIFNFDLLEKDLVIASLPHFKNDFSRKMLLPLYSINLTNFIV